MIIETHTRETVTALHYALRDVFINMVPGPTPARFHNCIMDSEDRTFRFLLAPYPERRQSD